MSDLEGRTCRHAGGNRVHVHVAQLAAALPDLADVRTSERTSDQAQRPDGPIPWATTAFSTRASHVAAGAVGAVAGKQISKAGERRAQRKWEKQNFQQYAASESAVVKGEHDML